MEGGKSPGEQGVGEGGKWESRGWEVGSIWGGGGRGERGSRNKEGDSLLFITGINQSKNTYLAKF